MGRPRKNSTTEIKIKKTPAWTCVVYPESAPENWIELMQDLHIPFIISPLHDKDKNDDGEIKKAHWHVLLKYASNKTFEQVKDDIQFLNCPIPQACCNVKGMVRYFIHIDNPEKYQYKKEDIQSYGGIDIEDYFTLTTGQENLLIKEILDYCRDNNITFISDLIDVCLAGNMDWFSYIKKNIYFFNVALSSRHSKQREKKLDERQDRIDRIKGYSEGKVSKEINKKEINNLVNEALNK